MMQKESSELPVTLFCRLLCKKCNKNKLFVAKRTGSTSLIAMKGVITETHEKNAPPYFYKIITSDELN